MSVGAICLGLYLILIGLAYLGVFSASNTVLGILALIAGIVILVDAYHPILPRRNP